MQDNPSEAIISDNGDNNHPSVFLFVSVYLIILAFFLLLNSISQIQPELSEKVLSNVHRTFPSKIKHNKSVSEIDKKKQPAEEIVLNGYFTPIGKVVKEAVTLVDASVIEYGNTMQITIPIESFFVTDEPDIRPEQEIFVIKLAGELTKLQTGGLLNLEFVIGTNNQTAQPNLEIARAGTFARKLSSLGVDENLLFVGISQMKKADSFTLTFRKHPE